MVGEEEDEGRAAGGDATVVGDAVALAAAEDLLRLGQAPRP